MFVKGKSGNPAGKKRGTKSKLHRDVAHVMETIIRVSDESTVTEAVNRTWRDQPATMFALIGKCAHKDFTLRAPDGLGGPQMDLTKLSDVELTTFAMLARKAQK